MISSDTTANLGAPVTLANNSTGWSPSYARIVADPQGAAIAWDLVDEAFTLSSVYGASYTVAGGWTAWHASLL